MSGCQRTLYLAIAEGAISPKLLNKAIQELAYPELALSKIDVAQVAKRDHTVSQHLLFHTAQCCYPVLGDPIIGFVTVGEGLSLHRSICPQILAVHSRQERLRPISWQELDLPDGAMFSGQLIMTVTEANSTVYKDIQYVVSKCKGIIRESLPIGNAKRPFRLSLKVDVENVDHLQNILTRLRQIEDVIDVKRIVDDKA